LATNDESCGVGILRLDPLEGTPSTTKETKALTPVKETEAPTPVKTKPPTYIPGKCVDDKTKRFKIGKKKLKCAKMADADKKKNCKK